MDLNQSSGEFLPASSGLPSGARDGAGFAGDRASAASDRRSDAGPSHRRVRPPKLYRIGEVVGYSGMSRQTIHNYTTMGLLRESRWTDGGHRLYDESVFERLDAIAELKRQNKSLEDIREQLARVEESHPCAVSPASLGGTGFQPVHAQPGKAVPPNKVGQDSALTAHQTQASG